MGNVGFVGGFEGKETCAAPHRTHTHTSLFAEGVPGVGETEFKQAQERLFLVFLCLVIRKSSCTPSSMFVYGSHLNVFG